MMLIFRVTRFHPLKYPQKRISFHFVTVNVNALYVSYIIHVVFVLCTMPVTQLCIVYFIDLGSNVYTSLFITLNKDDTYMSW